jgi:hypothetical protein
LFFTPDSERINGSESFPSSEISMILKYESIFSSLLKMTYFYWCDYHHILLKGGNPIAINDEPLQ